MMDSAALVMATRLSNWPGPSPWAPQASTYSKGGGGAGAAAVCAGREQPATIAEKQTTAAAMRLGLRTFGGTRAGSLLIGFAGLADAADYRLRQAIDALFFRATHLAKAKFGLTFWAFAETDRHLAAEIIFDEGGFVTGALLVPGVDAENGEITELSFGAARSSNQILRLVTGGSGDAVQLEPGSGADVGGGHAFAHGVRQVELDEASHDPAGDGNGLVAGRRGGVGFGAARGDFAGRAGGQAANEEPILFLGFLRFVVFALIADLHPIGDAAGDNLDGNSTAELIEARLGASGLDAKIGLHFGAAAGLHGHGFGSVQDLDAALPERGLKEQPGVDPADGAAASADFYGVVTAGHDVDAVAVVQDVDGLADLRDTAPQRGAALADVGFAEIFVLGAKEPGEHDDHAEQRDGDEELALHGRASGLVSSTKREGAFMRLFFLRDR